MRGRTQMRGKSWTYIIDFERDPLTGKRRQLLKRGFLREIDAQAALYKRLAEMEKKSDL